MALTVKRKPLVEHDLINIWRYTFSQWGEEQADHYLDELETAITTLAEQPYICRERTEFKPPVRILHAAHHLIIYHVINDELLLIRILHETMDIENHLDD